MNLIAILAIGTIAMLVPICIVTKVYRIPMWKSVFVASVLTVVGTLSTYVWYYIENGIINGWSFYGAVFLVPIVFLLVAAVMRIPYGQLMDMCAPAECVMLAIMKLKCMVDGCCGGRLLCYRSDGSPLFFPSQIAEFVNAWLVFAVLMALVFRKKNQGRIYLWYLIIYGSTRFVLNQFRDGTTEFMFHLPAGALWSVCSVVIGITILLVLKRKEQTVTSPS